MGEEDAKWELGWYWEQAEAVKTRWNAALATGLAGMPASRQRQRPRCPLIQHGEPANYGPSWDGSVLFFRGHSPGAYGEPRCPLTAAGVRPHAARRVLEITSRMAACLASAEWRADSLMASNSPGCDGQRAWFRFRWCKKGLQNLTLCASAHTKPPAMQGSNHLAVAKPALQQLAAVSNPPSPAELDTLDAVQRGHQSAATVAFHPGHRLQSSGGRLFGHLETCLAYGISPSNLISHAHADPRHPLHPFVPLKRPVVCPLLTRTASLEFAWKEFCRADDSQAAPRNPHKPAADCESPQRWRSVFKVAWVQAPASQHQPQGGYQVMCPYFEEGEPCRRLISFYQTRNLISKCTLFLARPRRINSFRHPTNRWSGNF
ncbi:hypothetical protein BU16DRAFT_532654 [Lophium mytilinum]|uniref:Uncharacterized protein n=1 Tax=Lophium mytilinum TaxID=390894 RepID=A0A6A6RBW9_9PEZI|nr:hypothetical protein BU16DRAFT_532654 [Lophium mytilinum]